MKQEDLTKIINYSKWKPDKKAIEWTKAHIKDHLKNDKFVWVTTDYSILFKKDSNEIEILDINCNYHINPQDTFENLSRVLKVLKKLNYIVVENEKTIINLDLLTRKIGSVMTIPKDTQIQQSTY